MQRINAVKTPEAVSEFLGQRTASKASIATAVQEVHESIQDRGWQAVAELTERFDGVKKPSERDAFRVPKDEFDRAASSLPSDLAEAIQTAIDRVRTFHTRQMREDWFLEEPGIRTGQIYRPLERVGLYAPGGQAPLFSTLIMTAVPAQIAGCPEVVVCSPPVGESGTVAPTILATCSLLGIEPAQVWSIGGAQAIFAMAAGLPGFPRVDGIFGPGNEFVVEAKRQVQGKVRIESLPGNSEILIIADETSNPEYVAADLLSQAEHAGGEMAILVSPSEQLLDRVEQELEKQLSQMKRKEIAENSLSTGGCLILTKDLSQACAIANEVAPEHLEIQVEDPSALIENIRHAGAIFLGPWSTEPIGDYTAGTNHVLPTGGAARWSSALSVDDYLKKISLIELEKEGIQAIGPPAIRMAEAEGLFGHADAIRLRLRDLEG